MAGTSLKAAPTSSSPIAPTRWRRAEQYPAQQVVDLPDALSVGADYGLTVIDGASVAAQEFAEFILSAEGQKILVSHGFAAV